MKLNTKELPGVIFKSIVAVSGLIAVVAFVSLAFTQPAKSDTGPQWVQIKTPCSIAGASEFLSAHPNYGGPTSDTLVCKDGTVWEIPQ